MKEFIVIKSIPVEELKEYKDYVGFLFRNKDGIFNICDTEEDIMKSNQWFSNLPVNAIVVSDENINPGDMLLSTSVNKELFGKTFKFVGYKETDLVVLLDNKNKEVISTKYILDGAYKVIRVANREDKIKMTTGVIKSVVVDAL